MKLENEFVAFGPVVQKSQTSRKLQLQNVGDIGVKFNWDLTKLTNIFSISPKEGDFQLYCGISAYLMNRSIRHLLSSLTK